MRRALFSFLSINILLGILFYKFFRPSNVLINKLSNALQVNNCSSNFLNLDSLPSLMGSNIVISCAILIWGGKNLNVWILILITTFILVIVEVLQIWNSANATFDFYDILFILLGSIFTSWYYYYCLSYYKKNEIKIKSLD